MNTQERAHALAETASTFPILGPTAAKDLLELVSVELGDAEVLDHFRPVGLSQLHAYPRSPILHVIAENTPASGLQSLLRGLLVGAHNYVKLPTSGLPEVEAFYEALPLKLAARVTIGRVLDVAWMEQAETVLVFGSEETAKEFRRRVRPDQTFLPHGHKVSFGVVFDDPACTSIGAAARDVAAFDQLGCLSPHVFFAAPNARLYAERLAGAMAETEASHPRGSVSPEVAKAIRSLREEVKFRASVQQDCCLWQSEGSTAWTVVYDESAGFPSTPLYRTIFVKPLPADFTKALREIRPFLSCAGIYPASIENVARIAECGISRICEIGQMQKPAWTWRQDGQMSLAPLVRWVTYEG